MSDPIRGEFHAFVTGTSGAIGGALARAIRTRHPKARISLVDMDEAKSRRLEGELGGEARTFGADLTDVAALPEVHAKTVGAFGPVNFLVNCAGIMDVRSMEKMPWDAGERVLLLDLMAPMRLMNLCVPGMVERRSGAIVNVASMAGRLPLQGCSYYGAAKAGIGMASEIVRKEVGGKGVHVLTVYPGPVESALERGARGQYAKTLLARSLPNGKPETIAARILQALSRNESEVIYPDLYKVGGVLGGLAGLAAKFTLNFGPGPKE